MSSLTKIIKASSAIGVFCGAAYVYFSKTSNSTSLQKQEANRVVKNLPDDIQAKITENLSNIECLSNQICQEIKIITPPNPMKKSMSTTFMEKINYNNNNNNFQKILEGTLNNLSVRTKNEAFLKKFILSNGLIMLKDLLSDVKLDFFSTDSVKIILSEILANISQIKESLELFEHYFIKDLLENWFRDDDIQLNLNAVKVSSNISQLKQNKHDDIIYTPDIFILDHKNNISELKDFDIVFINGMLGSVYFTWRQHDNECDNDNPNKTKCWPRDWLSLAIPRARIIGINALLKPFVWNHLSDIDKINRSIEDRAVQISGKLIKAGVGGKPILWVTHSAGGILLKHMLHLNENQSLALSTKGIMFMSTPHSGAQSMLGLYYFPFKYFLTPEAKHLETNSEKLLYLNNWFKNFVKERKIEILTLTETEPTQINKFYSTIIVPKCDGEFDGHQQLKVKSDHLYISKPKSQSDQIYLAVLDFVKKTMMLQPETIDLSS